MDVQITRIKSSPYPTNQKVESRPQWLLSSYRTLTLVLQYSKVVTGEIQEQHAVIIQNSTTLGKASGHFSALFRSFMEIATDMNVDEQLLAGTFRKSLRTVSADDVHLH
ncbi:hypothetical protein NPIL_521331 [Nephila pilipes]|uniref:Uncharacterized protein n=1 Tax=Nephila pilipes TaxID=299642 RepID=A0A8X6NHK1_NEPPI|nr:hypothetical protein NPIL_521331 [Nephila pilipes]